MRNVFGWDLPPGVSQRDIEEHFGDDEQDEMEGENMTMNKQGWVVGTMGHDTDIDAQCAELKAGEGTEREWVPVGIADENGFAEVVALAHPVNAYLIAASPMLYAALQTTECHLTNDHKYNCESDTYPQGEYHVSKCDCYLNMRWREIEAALALARGDK